MDGPSEFLAGAIFRMHMGKWRWQRGYEGIAACDDKWKDTRKSLDISIIGDIFISADNCRLQIIVEGTLGQME